ncbi:MAG: DUF2865 domain-containing protein, partial [Devosia sp.]
MASKLLTRLIALGGVVALMGLNASDALAQSRNCQSLGRTLAALEQSGDYQGADGVNARLRQLQKQVTTTESQYVRDGCNAAAKRGDTLSPQCKAEARQVLAARQALKDGSQQADGATAIAQQREAILQEMARFNCDSRSSAGVTQTRRGGLFDQLFGNFEDNFDDGVSTRGDQFSGYAGYETVRTVCVRKSDGYYWPVSYSTLKDYVPNDAQQCQEQCPNADVELYYYDNPGQEPDAMVNLEGQRYVDLATAFAYRTSYDPTNSCKAKLDYGTINLATLADGSTRAMISYDGQLFPLPLADPRRAEEVTVLTASATYVDIPLPRPRPAAPGEAPKPVAVQQAANDPERIVMFGDKRVRLVGPDTPYAPTA